MANQNQVLQALSSEGGLVTTENLATQVGTTQDTIRALCSKLKTKGYVDGSTKECFDYLLVHHFNEKLEGKAAA